MWGNVGWTWVHSAVDLFRLNIRTGLTAEVPEKVKTLNNNNNNNDDDDVHV